MLRIKTTKPERLRKLIRPYVIEILKWIGLRSLNSAAKEQGLKKLACKLEEMVPDIRNQYTALELDNDYLKTKVRYQHAFQISLVDKIIKDFDNPVIIDIGDSAGTHSQYIIRQYSKNNNIKCFSINSDEKAIEKIRKKGLNAVHAKAEDLDSYNINGDILLCFQTLEHMMDPCNFLYRLSSKTTAKYLIITVPYLKKSRVGLSHARGLPKGYVTAENTHIFELNPEDWKLILKHSGWNIVDEKIYLQYPKRSIFGLTKPLWRSIDFEGFYGVLLKKDHTWSSQYLSW